MAIKIYKHIGAHAIFIEDANGVQFISSLQASVDNGTCSVTDLAKNIEIVSDTPYGDFVDENNAAYGTTSVEVCDALNAIFQNSGTSTSSVPVITSSLSISSVQGSGINYELTADYGVGYEWDLSSVSGIANVEGNPRKLIGGSSLTSGTYNIPVKAINYNGEDSETLVLTVATPAFANTKSVKFDYLDSLSGTASLLDGTMGRAGNGSGSSDAWSVAFWVKPSTNGNNQGVMLYGGVYTSGGAVIDIRLVGSKDSLWIRYGTSSNRLQLQTPDNSLPAGVWAHCLITYDGGTTGAGSGNINDYYNRFNLFINGVSQTKTGTNNNYGYTNAITGSVFKVGESGQSQSLRDVKLDEIAIWSSDETANVASIYNSGVPFDLSTLTSDPLHWWRMGDGDTFPTITDSGSAGNCDFTMNNMTAASIVSDVPS
mgnify:CR=1 FL=1